MAIIREECPSCKQELKVWEYKICTSCKEKFNKSTFLTSVSEYAADYDSLLANKTNGPSSESSNDKDTKSKSIPVHSMAQQEYEDYEYGHYN